jgi:hypothetical protein
VVPPPTHEPRVAAAAVVDNEAHLAKILINH